MARHEFRNCDISNYVKAAEYLTSLGFYVLRMGALVEHKLVSDNPMIIDYAGENMHSDFMDLFLAANCSFCISNGTGFDALPAIFRKPILYVDQIPIDAFHTTSVKYMATTKKVFDLLTKEEISLSEILSRLNFSYHSEDYEKNGYYLVESSPDEILDYVKDMLQLIENDFERSPDCMREHLEFWSLFKKSHRHGQIISHVPCSFLKHRNLN